MAASLFLPLLSDWFLSMQQHMLCLVIESELAVGGLLFTQELLLFPQSLLQPQILGS
jgi:hypothetical protein